MKEYSERVALGVGEQSRTEVEDEDPEPEIPSLLKGTEDVAIDDIPEGDVDDLMEDTFATDVRDVQKASVTDPGDAPEPDDKPNSYTELIALAEHDPSVVDPDEVALNDLRKRAERGELQNPEVSDFGGESVVEAIEKATESVYSSSGGMEKEQVFREALAHATEMASGKQEAAQLAGDYVLKAVGDKKLAVKARAEAVQGFSKARQYVDDPSEAPSDVNCKEGPNGSLYYDPDERGRGNNETTGPTENTLLDMDGEELARAMDIDPTDPDESLADVEKQEPEEPIFDDRLIHGMISTASDAFDPDSGNANTVINAVTEFAPPGVNRGDVASALDGIFGDEDGVPVSEVAERLDGVIDGPFNLDGVDLRDFYGMISTMSAAVEPDDADANTIIDAVTDVAPPGHNRGDVAGALEGLFTEEGGEPVSEVADRLSPIFGEDSHMDADELARAMEIDPNDADESLADAKSVEKDHDYPDEWPFEPNADGVDTCARRFGPDEDVENARAFCENWYVEEFDEVPEGAEYVVDEADIEASVEEFRSFIEQALERGITDPKKIARHFGIVQKEKDDSGKSNEGVRPDWEERMDKDEDPCWDGYTMVGTKEDGSPRCVPEEDVDDNYDPEKAKGRRYVSDPDDAPDDVNVQEGQRGGYYYETDDLAGEEGEDMVSEEDLGTANSIVEDIKRQPDEYDHVDADDQMDMVEHAASVVADDETEQEAVVEELTEERIDTEVGTRGLQGVIDEVDRGTDPEAAIEEEAEFYADLFGFPEDQIEDYLDERLADFDRIDYGEENAENGQDGADADADATDADGESSPYAEGEDLPDSVSGDGYDQPVSVADMEEMSDDQLADMRDYFNADVTDEEIADGDAEDIAFDIASTAVLDVEEPPADPDEIEEPEGDAEGAESDEEDADSDSEEGGPDDPEELWESPMVDYEALSDEELEDYAEHLWDLHDEAREDNDDDAMMDVMDELREVDREQLSRSVATAIGDALEKEDDSGKLTDAASDTSKGRRYISDPDDAPEGVEPEQGPQGGWYYDADDLGGSDDETVDEEELTSDIMHGIAEIDGAANISGDEREDGGYEIGFDVLDDEAASEVMHEVAAMEGAVNISGEETDEGVRINLDVSPELAATGDPDTAGET